MHASDNPMAVPPKRANANPAIAARVNFSFSSIGDNNATQSGPVATNTTELATDVYSREDIHVAKCAARNMPEIAANIISLRVKVMTSIRYRVNAMGAIKRVANVSRKVAMTSEGAPVCAKRMKIEAVETASIAMVRLKGKMKRNCFSSIS